jgi:hypothetical protein
MKTTRFWVGNLLARLVTMVTVLKGERSDCG